jgi:hypothetical protein
MDDSINCIFQKGKCRFGKTAYAARLGLGAGLSDCPERDEKCASCTVRWASDANVRGHTLHIGKSRRPDQIPGKPPLSVPRVTHHYKVRSAWMATVQPSGAFVFSFPGQKVTWSSKSSQGFVVCDFDRGCSGLLADRRFTGERLAMETRASPGAKHPGKQKTFAGVLATPGPTGGDRRICRVFCALQPFGRQSFGISSKLFPLLRKSSPLGQILGRSRAASLCSSSIFLCFVVSHWPSLRLVARVSTMASHGLPELP